MTTPSATTRPRAGRWLPLLATAAASALRASKSTSGKLARRDTRRANASPSPVKLANGRLTDRNKETAFAGKMEILKREAQRLKTTVDGLALAAVIAQPWVDIVLSGAARIKHLQSNLRALNVLWDEEAASALNGLAESEVTYWKYRSDLGWN